MIGGQKPILFCHDCMATALYEKRCSNQIQILIITFTTEVIYTQFLVQNSKFIATKDAFHSVQVLCFFIHQS